MSCATSSGSAGWLLTHRIAVIVGALLLVAVSSLGLGRLGFKNDYRMFFSKENPELLAFEVAAEDVYQGRQRSDRRDPAPG